jgi:hypothetical protein
MIGRMGIGRIIERAGEAAELPFTCSVIRPATPGGQGHGYATASALPWLCQHHKHRALYGHEPGALQRYLEMSTQLDEAKTELEAAQSVLRRRLKPGTLQTWPRAVLRCRRSLSMSPKKP